MRQIFKKYRDDSGIIEAILRSDDESTLECLQSDGTGSIGEWSQIVAVARATTPKVDSDGLESSVLNKIHSSAQESVEHNVHVVHVFSRRWIFGSAGIAVACLFFALSVFRVEPGLRMHDAPFETSQPSQERSVGHLKPVTENERTTYAALSNTSVAIDDRGFAHLSVRKSSGTVRITNPSQLNIVNGDLHVFALID